MLLCVCAVSLARSWRPRLTVALAGSLLAALIVGYAASRTVGLPLAREHTELVGLIAALRLHEPLALRKDNT